MNNRNYRIQGHIACLFSPGSGLPPTTSNKPNIEIQFLHKGALNTIFLGKGLTDDSGNFTIDLRIDSPINYIVDGKITDVFAKIFFNGTTVNPTTTIPVITLHEGYNEIAPIEIDITDLEVRKLPDEIVPNISNTLPVSNSALFQLYYDLHQAVPDDLVAIFSVLGAEGDIQEEITLNPDTEGYIQLTIPLQPIVVIKPGIETIINYFVDGPFDRRDEENYLEVSNGTGSNIYTLIWDIVVHDDLLQIKDGSGNYHKILPSIGLTSDIDAVYINKKGQIYGFNNSTLEWDSLGVLNFTRFEFPENLTVVIDGFYEPSTSSGTVSVGTLGETGTPFEAFFGTVKNQEPYFVKVGLHVFNSGGGGLPPVYSGEFTLMPTDTNVHLVLLGGTPPVPIDHSPTLSDIQTISGVTFSAAFESFLTSKGLTTADKVRKAGPITYINDFPTPDVGPVELETLQGHVDLFSVNSDPSQNQRLITLGYGNIQKIGNTPKNIFLNDVVDATLPLFEAAKIHEVVSQNQVLVTNLLGGFLTDLQLVNPATPNVPGSNFITTSLANAVNTCGCDDCKSGVSPFAYLLDLIKYGAAHIQHTTTPLYNPGGSINDFVTLITDKFLQPFGTLNVDCDTLHHEYCRVRLVTEVFEKLVDIKIANGTISPAHIAQLTTERNQFLLLTYKSILIESGTSIEELRDVITTKPESEKIIVAQALANKLGIPLYDPIYPNFTADRMWLTLTNVNPLQKLTAVNLEAVFGFRDTKRNVLTNTPLSIMEQWRSIYLRNAWKNEDYSFTDYSRENVVAANNATFKSNWKPIIDPDIMGWIDMTYLTSSYAKALWDNRKKDTDNFLSYCLNNNTNTTRTSADFNNRILRVLDRDIVSHVLDGNIIQIERPAGTWNNFNVLNLTLNQTNTDVILKKSSPSVTQPAMLKPATATPKMRYKRVLNVISGSIVGSGTSIVINWPNPVFSDQLIGGYARLESTVGASPYQTAPPGVTPLLINTVTFNTSQQVTLTFPSPGPNAAFIAGDVKFIYEVEVPIFTDVILNPEDISNVLFTVNQNYTLLTPVPAGMTSPLVYKVWTVPAWPVIITAPTNYGKLKQMYQFIAAGTSVTEFTVVIENNLHMTLAAFNQMMLLMIKAENYVNSMYTFARPTTEELYQLASIFRNSAKTPLRDTWVKEEIKGSATPPAMLMLNGQYFWSAITEPVEGPWDPSLQTIPTTVGAINSTHVAIIDPELVSVTDLIVNPEAKPYRDLYDARKLILQGQFNTFKAFTQTVVFDPNAFTKMLNQINTGNPATPFNILPYTSLSLLLDDLQSPDLFKQKTATDVLFNAFRLTRDQFLEIAPIKSAYELNDPVKLPTTSQLDKTISILVSAFKRKRLYPGAVPGWIAQEITGTFPSGAPVFYYNVIKMRMATGRTDFVNRKLWQNTLSAWNRQPFIQSDIIPPENIKNFVPANWVYTTWNLRRIALINAYNSIAVYINPSVPTAGALFTNFKGQIDLLIRRVSTFVPPGPLDYLHYFTDIILKEINKEDIRPYVLQLGMSLTEYRFLSKIYKVLENATPSGPSPLIDSEYPDVIDILIHVRNVNLPFAQVQEEYAQGILLDQDYFQIYKPVVSSFPITELPTFNKWRSPYNVRKAWLDTLQTRIDKEKAVIEKWQDILAAAEDINMPYMRDSLIRALTNNCELFEDAQERLAKTYFVETKDNCCVKHSRASFAIETLQGLFFALENGVYDDFISDFKLIAPYFTREWQWLGSYATWRSAMFVYLYPENLLYPTLKRKQSPAFFTLSDTLRNANRFSPEDACFEAKQFQNYLRDVEEIEIVCSTSGRSYYEDITANECCSPGAILKWETYFFGQTKAGKPYWCIKQTEEWDGLGFWQPLPIEVKNITLLGCYILGTRGAGWAPIELSLYLFYSYLDSGKLKMGHIKKPLFDLESSWSSPIEMEDLPTLDDIQPAFVTACQLSIDWEIPCFIFSYGKVVNHDQTITVDGHWEHNQMGKPGSWYVPPSTTVIPYPATNNVHLQYYYDRTGNHWHANQLRVFNNVLKPVTAIFHPLSIGGGRAGISIIFPNAVNMGFLGKVETASWPLPLSVFQIKEIIGAFESRFDNDTIILHYRDTSNVYRVTKLTVNSDMLAYDPITSPVPFPIVATAVTSNIPTNLIKIYPFFQERDAPRTYALKDNSNRSFGAKILDASTTANYCILHPEKITDIVIQSADCINDMGIRKADVELKLKKNMNQPQGTSTGWIKRPSVVRELLYESFYFVPMLLALDQQKRGQYVPALNWYRTVYDYTNSIIDQRKIFYGLKLEETIVNVFTQAPDWLLDPLNPHLIAQTRAGAYTKYTLMNIIQCIDGFADREFTMDTIETVPIARKLYTEALDLLKVKELNYKADMCVVTSNACLDAAVGLETAKTWGNLYTKLKDDLSGLGSEAVISSITGDIADLLNSATNETYPEKFAAAFALIETSTPPPGIIESITGVIDGQDKRLNDASRYLFALNDPKDFNASVSDMYTVAVAGISGLSFEDVSTPDATAKISWLLQAPKDNATSLEFGFKNSGGQQLLSGDLAYNPMNPGHVAITANLGYYNAPSVIGLQPINMPVTFAPLITFGDNFCMPQNPVYKSLQLKGNLELYKIFNCRNIAGIVRELDVFAAATDSSTGIPIIGASGNLVLPGLNNFAPTQYRFSVLLERAKQIAAQAQQMESLFLASLEKEDAENYAQLRAKQDLETSRATIKLQDLRINQAKDERTSATIQLDKVNFSQAHYNNLIAEGLNGFENGSLKFLASAEIAQYIAAGLSIAASVPDFYLGKIGQGLSALASASSSVAAALSTQSSFLSQLASFKRREQEWQFQSQLTGFDISLANQQIKLSDDNIRIVTQEREIATLNNDHAQQAVDFLKNKFTNAELYNWMGGVLERSYSYMLNLSTAIARTAEGQLYFERQEQAGPFILDDYWETPSSGFTSGTSDTKIDRRGLTGSARLLVDITRLEQHALDTNKRKLQMTKIISLAQNFPSEFQNFKQTGVINFELTNKLFDYDFPGHYLRLVNSVKTTVVGLLPVYDGIKATLTAEPISYTVIGGTTFQKIPIRRVEVDSVALTSPNNASGVFELQPIQNELLRPFEAMGLESRWEFKLPQFSNRFDYGGIADVILSVEYTAFDSFQYKTQVLLDIDNALQFNRGFSFKNNFPDQWYELGEAQAGSSTFAVTVQLKREFFPQGIQDLKLDGSNLSLLFIRATEFEDEIENFDFSLAGANPSLNKKTVNGVFSVGVNTPGNTPIMNLTLVFDNNFTNRELFSKGNVTDIALLVGCKATLTKYPL